MTHPSSRSIVSRSFVAVRGPTRHNSRELVRVWLGKNDGQESPTEVRPNPDFLGIVELQTVLPQMLLPSVVEGHAGIWNVNHRSTLTAVTVEPNGRHCHDRQAF